LHALGNRPDRCHAGTPPSRGSVAEPARNCRPLIWGMGARSQSIVTSGGEATRTICLGGFSLRGRSRQTSAAKSSNSRCSVRLFLDPVGFGRRGAVPRPGSQQPSPASGICTTVVRNRVPTPGVG
jgi:hypothetical protein